jgi:transcriptional regulator with XRE-family HTH domain
MSIGERIAFYRIRRGLTQAVLAGLVGRSEDWLSKIERGERQLRRVDVLTDLAGVLRVSLGDLLGQPVLVEDQQVLLGDDVPAVRDALMSPRRLSRVLFEEQRPTVEVRADDVANLVEHVWDAYQRGRLGQVITALPGLIRSAQQLEESPSGHASWAASARVHHLAATTLANVGESDLAWLAAERAMRAGDHAGHPFVLASAARAGTHALLAIGRYDDALDLGITAASWLQSQVDRNDPNALSLAGMLYLRTAVAAARRHDRGTARELLRRAADAAERLGEDGNYWQTGFGPTNVSIHEFSAALDLGDVAFVVEHAPGLPVAHMPVERGVSHRIDLARALSLVARDDDALSELLTAEQRSSQLVRHSAAVRETVRTMHRRAPVTAGGGSSPLFGLAERCRVV